MNHQTNSLKHQIESDSEPTLATEGSAESKLQHLDLSFAIADRTLSIHSLEFMSIRNDTACAEMRVFDLNCISVSPSARQAISGAYITPLFLVEAFARHYRETLLRELRRGNEKGRTILDPIASIYVHPIASGGVLVVRAETVAQEGQFTRRLTIIFEKETVAGSAV